MQKLYLLLAVIISTGFASAAFAQDGPRFGLGIGLSNSSFGFEVGTVDAILSPVSIFVPITLNALRVEPEIGIFRVSSQFGEFEETATGVQIGAGVFVLRPVGSTNLYLGGRAGITRMSLSSEGLGGSEEASSNNFFVGPAAGGEYFFDEHFSLGGEAQILYTSVGSEEEDDNSSASVIRTRGIFFVRWHL